MKPFLMVLIFAVIFSLPAKAQTFVGDRYASMSNDVLHSMRCAPPLNRCHRVKTKRHKPHYSASRAHRRVIRQVVPSYRTNTGFAPTARFLEEAGQAIVAPVQQVFRTVESAVVGSRPAGCPHRFCACALSIKVFGRQVAGLNLAANWLRFPRAHPASGMVAARRGHVFQLISHISGTHWQVWDANSGRGRIRIHARSIAGFAIVDPRRS